MADEANRELWRERIKRWEASGLSQSAFAREHGYSAWQISYWKEAFAKRNEGGNLVPVVIKQNQAANPSSIITLHSASGWVLSIPPNCSAAWVGEILQKLR